MQRCRLVPFLPDFKRTEDAKRLAARPDDQRASGHPPLRAHGEHIRADFRLSRTCLALAIVFFFFLFGEAIPSLNTWICCTSDNILISESVSSHMQILKRDMNFTAAGKIPVMVLTHQSTKALSLVRAWVRIGTAGTAVHFLSLHGLLPRRQRQTRPSGRCQRRRQPAKINIKKGKGNLPSYLVKARVLVDRKRKVVHHWRGSPRSVKKK